MKTLIAFISISLAFTALSGCEQAEEAAQTAAQKTENAVKQVAQNAEEQMDRLGTALEDTGDDKATTAAASGNTGSDDILPLEEDVAQGAVAILHATAGNKVKGTVYFRPRDGALSIQTTATVLSPGDHGYHIHLYGDSSAPDGTSAGTHFNLEGSSLNPQEDIDRITGNLGILKADQNGNAEHSGQLAGAALTGPKSIIGRAVIVHAKANDASQPPIGAAGSRLACGVIGIADSAASP